MLILYNVCNHVLMRNTVIIEHFYSRHLSYARITIIHNKIVFNFRYYTLHDDTPTGI